MVALAPVLPFGRHAFLGLGGLGDQTVFAWDFWWVGKAVAEKRPIFWTDFIYFPEGVSLVNHTLLLLPSLLMSPLVKVWGAPLCYNLLVGFSTWLCCLGAFAMGRELGLKIPAAFGAGIAFGLSAFRAVQLSGGQINVAMLEGVVWQGVFWLRFWRQPYWGWGVAWALCWLVMGWTEKMLLVFAALLDIALSVGCPQRRPSMPARPVFLGVSLLLLCGLAPLVWMTWKERSAFPKPPSLVRDVQWFWRWVTGQVSFARARAAVRGSWGSAGAESADVLHFLGLHPHRPVWFPQTAPTHHLLPPRVFAGWSVLVPVLVGWLLVPSVRRKGCRLAVAATFFAFLCLGPLLQVNGRILPLPLPYALLHYLPLLGEMRAPHRFTALTSLFMAMLWGLAMSEVSERSGKSAKKGTENAGMEGSTGEGRAAKRKEVPMQALQWLFFVASFCLVGEHLSWWWRLQPLSVPIPPILRRIAAERDDAAVLEIPIGRWGGTIAVGTVLPQSVYFQTICGKRVMTGCVSRAAPRSVMALRRHPVLSALLQLQRLSPPDPFPHLNAEGAVVGWLRRWRVRYVFVYAPYRRTFAHLWLCKVVPMRRRYQDNLLTVYEVVFAARQGARSQPSLMGR